MLLPTPFHPPPLRLQMRLKRPPNKSKFLAQIPSHHNLDELKSFPIVLGYIFCWAIF